MGDHHHHHQHHHHAKNIGIAVLLNLMFTIIELVGGILTNSVAVISDAIHDLGDTIILSFSFFSEKYAGKKTEDQSFTYGLGRLPLLSAFLSSLILIIGSIFVLMTAIPRLKNPETVNATGMLILSVPGIIINTAALLKLRKNEGLNSRVLWLHFLEDALGWVAIMAVSIVMHFVNLPVLDPVLSIIITLYILARVAPSLKKSFLLFIQKAPADIDVDAIRNEIEKLPNIKEICDFHMWSLDSIHHVFTAHVRLEGEGKKSKDHVVKTKSEIRNIVKRYGDFHSTIEIEYEDESCLDHC